MNEVKMTDSDIGKLVRAAGLGQREKGIVELALQIYMRKFRVLTEARVKELLRYLENARVISSSDKDRILKKMSAEYEK